MKKIVNPITEQKFFEGFMNLCNGGSKVENMSADEVFLYDNVQLAKYASDVIICFTKKQQTELYNYFDNASDFISKTDKDGYIYILPPNASNQVKNSYKTY